MATVKPATPLHGRRIILQGGYVFEVEHQHAEHLDVLQHRANAYPKLVEALREYMAAQERLDGRTTMDEARGRSNLRALLTRLGERA